MRHLPVPRLLSSAACIIILLSLSACDLAFNPGLPALGTPTAQSAATTPNACANAYFPVVQGASWTYAVSGHLSGTLSRVITAVKADGFTDQHTAPAGGMQTTEWDCDDGIISMQPDTAPSGLVQAGDLAADLHVTDSSGVTVPDNLGPGAVWNQESTLDGTTSINGQSAPAHNDMTMLCNAGSHETVAVPAASFSALRADCKTEETLTVTLNGAAIATNIMTASTIWYAPGVGVIRLEQVIANGPQTIFELTSYNIP